MKTDRELIEDQKAQLAAEQDARLKELLAGGRR